MSLAEFERSITDFHSEVRETLAAQSREMGEQSSDIKGLRRELLGNGQPGRIQRIEKEIADHKAGHTWMRRTIVAALISAVLSLGVAMVATYRATAAQSKPSPTAAR